MNLVVYVYISTAIKILTPTMCIIHTPQNILMKLTLLVEVLLNDIIVVITIIPNYLLLQKHSFRQVVTV